MSPSVLLAGGGTTGHVAPLLALAGCLHRRDPGIRLSVLGTAEGLESRLVPAAGLPLMLVPRVPLPRRAGADLARLPGRLTEASRAAGRAIEQSGADVVVGFGGYVCAPAYLAARRRRLPIVVHEGNARPGVANRLGARLTRHVAVTFPGTPLRGAGGGPARVTGLPLRPEISGLDRPARRDEARASFGLLPATTTLLVTGGSLGAQRLNVTIGACAADLAEAGVQVLHAAGHGKSVDVRADPPPETPAEGAGNGFKPPYRVLEYLERMDLAYAAADALVCRAGAGTVSEVSAVGLPAAYVPLPVGNGEQRLNAQPVVAAGGGLLVEDAACTPDWVRGPLLELLQDQDRLAAMGAAAATFGIRDGAERLADMVAEAVGSRVWSGP